MSKGFYDKARRGRPITLSLWRGDVVAVEAAGGTERFLPSPVWRLVLWLFAAHAGLGVVLWGLLADRSHRRTPFFEYAFVWMLLGALLAFPAILLAIVILAVLGPGAINAALAVAIVNIPVFARLARANVLAEKHKEYVSASRAIGASPMRILFRGILPNSLATIIVQVTVSFASAVLLESSLSFLGLGVPLPAPSWGSMLSVGRGYMNQAPWYSIFPGLAIMLLVLGVYLLGDGLRDVLDPRRQKII